ncbi:MAG: alpha/beta fold hydrolase [Thermoguttaceae bacterium]|jgi:pimeloyl-ACP methyl ester carboxylesterase
MFVVWCLTIAVLIGMLLIWAVTWVWYVPLIARAFGEPPWLHARSFPSVEGAEACEFATADGLVLRGSYLPATTRPRQGVILFCHELGGDRWGAVGYAGELRNRGFDLFTFDFRNQGVSDRMPNYQPMPWLTHYELADVQAAINYLCSRPDADSRGIGVFGVSRGGNAALCVAAGDTRVRAVVTDGAFPIDGMLRHYIRRFMKIWVPIPLVKNYLPDVCLISYYKCAKVLLGFRRGCRFVNVEQACRRVRQPVFMIHGERDMYIPLKVAEALRSSLSGRSKFWIVPGVKHNGAMAGAEDEYYHRIWRFFQRHLAHGTLRSATVVTTQWQPGPPREPTPTALG